MGHAICTFDARVTVRQIVPTKTLEESSMASRHQVRCINKTDRYNPHERIKNIGGANNDGTAWKIPQEEAIIGIESGKWEFYVSRQGRTVDVIVAVSAYGHKYLKTTADGVQPDNLLALPECP
jgi:hypothetical protein